MNKAIFLQIVLLLICITQTYGQIAIGTTIEPSKASILELKNIESNNPSSVSDANNRTSDIGGLGLPRVMLINKLTLEPFVSISDPNWTSPTSKIKAKHVGLMVYNIYESPSTEADPNKMFKQGIYVWNGQSWHTQGLSKRHFPCPAFNLPLPWISRRQDADFTFDLYKEYEKQYTASKNTLMVSNNPISVIKPTNLERLYKKEELDFVVTHYDKTVLTINAIDANGVMSYRVLDHDPAFSSFINIIFVIKE